MRLSLLASAALFALLLAVVVLLQWQGGAFTGFFANDAAAHYVTGMAVRDWLGGLPSTALRNPIRFVIDYHAHLPLTGFGLWPPLYHAVEGLWMLLIGSSKTSVLLLSGIVTALTGTAVGLAVCRRAGWVEGLFAGLVMVANPLAQRASGELMLDMPSALAIFLAVRVYAAFLARGGLGIAIAFGICAVAALLVKYNTLALALVPPLCVLIARRWDLLLRRAFYAPAVLVAVLAGPLYLKTRSFVEQGFRFSWGAEYVQLASVYNALSLFDGLTPLVAPLALAGLVRALWLGGRTKDVAPMEVAFAALAISVLLFLLAVPVALQDRYMLPALAPLVVLAGCECARLRRMLRQPVLRALGIALPLAGVVFAALPPQRLPQDRAAGAIAAMKEALPPGNPVVLLVADGDNEPALIAEIAMRQSHPAQIWVIRGARLLGGGGFNNADYQPRFADTAAMLREIDRYGVAMVILQRQTGPRAWAHVGQFAGLVEQRSERFEKIALSGDPSPFEVLRLRGNQDAKPDPVALTALSGPGTLMRMVE